MKALRLLALALLLALSPGMESAPARAQPMTSKAAITIPEFVRSKDYADRSRGNLAAVAIDRYVHLHQEPFDFFKGIKIQRLDLNHKGSFEEYTLAGGRLKVTSGGQTLWETPGSWWVSDFVLGDSTNDGTLNLNISVWKEGSFGPSRPFWVTEEDKSFKNHLFIYKLTGETFKPVWQSSNLDRPNHAITLADLDGDGKYKLIATEGDYANPQFRQVTVWQWNGWGFSKITN